MLEPALLQKSVQRRSQQVLLLTTSPSPRGAPIGQSGQAKPFTMRAADTSHAWTQQLSMRLQHGDLTHSPLPVCRHRLQRDSPRPATWQAAPAAAERERLQRSDLRGQACACRIAGPLPVYASTILHCSHVWKMLGVSDAIAVLAAHLHLPKR